MPEISVSHLESVAPNPTTFSRESRMLEQVGCLTDKNIKVEEMRKGIHPDYKACVVTCACGNSFEIRSNREKMTIDICNECHPFFTGSEKIVDATGRVDKFRKKYNL